MTGRLGRCEIRREFRNNPATGLWLFGLAFLVGAFLVTHGGIDSSGYLSDTIYAVLLVAGSLVFVLQAVITPRIHVQLNRDHILVTEKFLLLDRRETRYPGNRLREPRIETHAGGQDTTYSCIIDLPDGRPLVIGESSHRDEIADLRLQLQKSLKAFCRSYDSASGSGI